jgi:hypothetical protein
LTALPGFAEEKGSEELRFVSLGTGGEASLWLYNPSGQALLAEIAYFDESGTRGGRAQRRRSTGGDFVQVPAYGAVIVRDARLEGSGSVAVSANGRVVGLMRAGSRALAAEEPGEICTLPVRGNERLGVATAGSSVTVRFELRDDAGEMVPGGVAEVQIQENGSLVRGLEELFPSMDLGGFFGTITIRSSGGPVVATVER